MADFFSDVADTISDYASMGIQELLEATIYKWMYYLVCGLCKLVHYLDQMFQVFSGQTRVAYNGAKDKFLIDVFFENHAVSNVYWAMALIGIVLAFAVAVVAVARKMFDGRDKDQRSLGQILGSLAKSLLLILTMNIIMMVVLSLTGTLLQQINFSFDNANDLDKAKSIDFTDEQYAAMGRILNTIGNYSMNPSYESTYNINSCFNEIRPDLDYLDNQGVFDFYYVTKDASGKEIDTWQSVIEEIAFSANLSRDLKLDVYYESVSRSIKHAVNVLQTNQGFKPISHYERQRTQISQNIPIDRFAFLVGTMSAAKTDKYNVNPSITDGLRGPYYYGEKNIYNVEQAMNDFNFGFGANGYSYLINLLVVIALIWNLAVIIFSCVTRIFMMMVLYLIGPLVFAIEPLDDGEKRKQWTIAFTVQAFSVLGTVIAMRVLLLFIPVIIDNNLVLFDSSTMDLLGKTVLLIGGFIVAKKASGVITGILANSAGMQSINSDASGWGDRALAAPLQVLGGAWAVTKGVGSVVKWGYDKVKSDDQSSGSSGGSSGSAIGSNSSSGGSLPESNHSTGDE